MIIGTEISNSLTKGIVYISRVGSSITFQKDRRTRKWKTESLLVRVISRFRPPIKKKSLFNLKYKLHMEIHKRITSFRYALLIFILPWFHRNERICETKISCFDRIELDKNIVHLIKRIVVNELFSFSCSRNQYFDENVSNYYEPMKVRKFNVSYIYITSLTSLITLLVIATKYWRYVTSSLKFNRETMDKLKRKYLENLAKI